MSSSPSSASIAALVDLCCTHVPLWECGALGADNAWRLASTALQTGDAALCGVGAQLARFAWEADPLDPRLSRLVAALEEDGLLAAPAASLAQDVARRCRVPGDHALLHSVTDGNALRDIVLPRLADPAHGAFWLGRGVAWCMSSQAEDAAATLDMLLAAFPGCHPALSHRLRTAYAVLHGTHGEAHTLLETFAPSGRDGVAVANGAEYGGHDATRHGTHTPFMNWAIVRRAALLAEEGDTAEASALLRRVWTAMPWHPNLVLALHELERPHPAPPKDTPPPAILLYSWNKRDVLAATLDSLRASGTGDAPVFVLDNGSTDGTDTMLDAIARQWGSPFTKLHLPVNIGAPAARNWLLSLDALKRHDRVVFLDDDVLLDHGWLDGLLSVAVAHPSAAVVGCRITDAAAPHAVQCADFFALPPALGQRSFADLEEHLFIHGNAGASTDTLLTAYSRPCLSVSGCCHLFDRAALDACGHFDIRFSPSQFDDLEHDLRTVLSGREVWYAGGVRVRHVQHSSLRQAADRARSAHIFGNRIKLEHLYPAQRAAEARETSALAARRDLLRKASRLAGTGSRP
ncbi:glycosyltransferase family 2 protein [Nitratidesulfovibrio vulgaris]|nr:glycosyltransferase [Nitratidesulfovibrio vulgaris]ADP87324.1 glycosyl transferase family 2 [Nitratidesulfovibrio vulgaris RCH1]